SVGRITLNRPRALNALTLDMCVDIREALDAWNADGRLRCLILCGAGGKAFCAGGDVKSVAAGAGAARSGPPGRPGTLAADFFREEYHTDHALALLKLRGTAQQVSIWDGVVMGGGAGVSMHGAFRVATETTLFAMPEAGIGLFPDVGGSHVLPRLRGGVGVGTYIGLTGHRLRAADLIHCGLATHYVPRDRLPGLLEQLESGGG
ncbi:unnamed protein product, partial [Phaeothamnion confervicola]